MAGPAGLYNGYLVTLKPQSGFHVRLASREIKAAQLAPAFRLCCGGREGEGGVLDFFFKVTHKGIVSDRALYCMLCFI